MDLQGHMGEKGSGDKLSNVVLLSVTNKTKKFEHSLEIEKRHKPATINY